MTLVLSRMAEQKREDKDAVRVRKISTEEKQRRREQNLCLYGGKNHFASDCPIKKTQLAVVTMDSENKSA